ncbi:MAG TPA: M24 family metallopeptidase, partial [Roseiflexaceae bacterium]
MKRDLDRLMAERNIDALVVEGPDGLGSANPDFNYFVNSADLTGIVIKKRGEPAMLLHSPWEQLQAETTGLVLISTSRWNMRDILNEIPDRFQAYVELRRRIFTDLGIGGRVGIYGTVRAGEHFALLTGLAQKLPGLEIVAEFEKDIISEARLTKEPEEVEIMRRVGRKTCAVVQAVVDFIRTGHADGDTLMDASGAPITIGHVKELIRRELAAQGLEAPQGTIFAQGRDAGLPHATGDEAAPLVLGQAIVFDIFPRELGGGYFHDMTRTFAIGYAPPQLQKIYDDVRGAL